MSKADSSKQPPETAGHVTPSDDVPELYCPGCLTEFGFRVPAVFVPPRDSAQRDSYAVCCPAAGLVQKDTDALCHGGPYDHAIGSDGRTWKYLGNNRGFVSYELTSLNGHTFSRPRRYLRRKLRKWRVSRASSPPMHLNDDVPRQAVVKAEFDWDSL